jgi:hypothetical protein
MTQKELATIINSNPNTDKRLILNRAIERGYIIEGYNEPKPNLAQKVADMAIGGATNIKNTFDATMDATGSYLGKKARGIDTTYSQEMKGAVDNIQSDVTGNAATNILFGRDQQARDLSTAKGWEQLGGDALSTAATVMPAGKAMQGATLGAKVAQGAKIGATVGALGGAGTSMQEGNSLGEVAKDTAIGAGAGAVIGGAIPAVGAGISKGAELVKGGAKKVSKPITNVASEVGTQYREGFDAVTESTKSALNPFKTNSTEVAISIPKRDGTYMLKKISEMTDEEKFATQQNVQSLYGQMLEKAKKFIKDRRDTSSPLEIVGQNTDKALQTANFMRKQVGKQMGEVEKSAANVRVDLSKTRLQDFMDHVESVRNGAQYGGTKGQTPEVKQFLKDLNLLQKKGTSVDEVLNFTRQWSRKLDNLKDNFGQFKDNRYDNSLLQDLVGQFKNSARDTLGEINPNYRELVTKYRMTSMVRDEGNRLLGKEGMLGDTIRGAATAKRAVQSNSDGGSRQFYNYLKELTGYDGMQEADIAIQAMKDAGDYQGLNLLEVSKDIATGKSRLPDSMLGWTQFGIGKLYDKVRPEAEQRTSNFIKNNHFQTPNVVSTMPMSANITPTINIPAAISNISDIIKHSPELAKGAIIEMIKGLPTGVRNTIIKELANQVNDKLD